MHGMEHGGSTTPGDITTMGGLRKHMPITRITFLISCLAIAGIVPFAGLLLEGRDPRRRVRACIRRAGRRCYGKILWAGLLVAALGTAFYMWRLYFLVFAGEERTDAAKHAHESPLVDDGAAGRPRGVRDDRRLHRAARTSSTSSCRRSPTRSRSWLEPSVTARLVRVRAAGRRRRIDQSRHRTRRRSS